MSPCIDVSVNLFFCRIIHSYERSPVEGDGTYPNKNVQADAITTSIISNRFLVEAALMPWSLTLYFVDIASVHLMILKVSGHYVSPLNDLEG